VKSLVHFTGEGPGLSGVVFFLQISSVCHGVYKNSFFLSFRETSVPFGYLEGLLRGIPRALCGEMPEMGSAKIDFSEKSLWGG